MANAKASVVFGGSAATSTGCGPCECACDESCEVCNSYCWDCYCDSEESLEDMCPGFR